VTQKVPVDSTFAGGHPTAVWRLGGRWPTHRCMAWGGQGLPKLSLGPAMPYPSTLCGPATPETALWPFQGRSACRAGGLRPSSTPLDTPRRTPMTITGQDQTFIVLRLKSICGKFWRLHYGPRCSFSGEIKLGTKILIHSV
jgi:hypothetical protein